MQLILRDIARPGATIMPQSHICYPAFFVYSNSDGSSLFLKCLLRSQDQSRSRGARAMKGLALSGGAGGMGEGRRVFNAALPEPCLPDAA